jgi:hypothetical protein
MPDIIKKRGILKLKKMIFACSRKEKWLVSIPDLLMPSKMCRYSTRKIAMPRA